MKKKMLGALLAAILAFSLVGCSANTPSSEPKANNNSQTAQTFSEPQDLILVDSNYVLSGGGYVMYALELQNPNESYAADFATVTVTSKHSDGSIGFSDEWVISNILPGSTTYWASQAGRGDTTDADTVSIRVSVNNSNWKKTDQTLPVDLYAFDNVTVAPAQYSGIEAKGEVTLNEDFSYNITDAEQPILVCVLKDANGAIITGFSGFLTSELSVGSPSVFDITGYFDAPEYATAEMYANMWM